MLIKIGVDTLLLASSFRKNKMAYGNNFTFSPISNYMQHYHHARIIVLKDNIKMSIECAALAIVKVSSFKLVKRRNL